MISKIDLWHLFFKKTYSGSGTNPPEPIPLHRNNPPPVPTYFFERCAAPEH